MSRNIHYGNLTKYLDEKIETEIETAPKVKVQSITDKNAKRQMLKKIRLIVIKSLLQDKNIRNLLFKKYLHFSSYNS